MTCVAWDGVTLAADKMAAGFGIAQTVTKIHRVQAKLEFGRPVVPVLAATIGVCDTSAEILEWLKAGQVPKDFPESARNWESVLVVIAPGYVLQWVGGPYPMRLEDKQLAWGSGGDLARVAMHLGQTAEQAVKLACKFAPATCGNGINTLRLKAAR